MTEDKMWDKCLRVREGYMTEGRGGINEGYMTEDKCGINDSG